MNDYKTQFNEEVTHLITRQIEDRGERMATVQALIDRYISEHGATPDPAQLERLTDYILREELTDRHPDKITRNEYPFMSTWQLDVRHDRETSFKMAEEIGTDGRDYRVPKRRKRSTYESIFVDQAAKIRNKERAEQYKRDTATRTTAEYNLYENGGELTESFVQCRGIKYR
ncbi:hypothetical protein [Paenibacillus campinasensis]|uniref:Uncharacterized protein n=1 Tax=Paenibacillus campinasensis TaxID=66347 RepID=A0A268EH29_9BACL|nr:hypothetical protein [Paenibacillus campinasensis]PAD72430.1 hypothetical protein CHH67_22580 [Paenibacillus campinasensis]